MGWFLTNGNKTKKKTKRSKAAGPTWDPQRTLLGVKFAGAIGAVIALALAWHFTEDRLLAYADSTRGHTVSADDIVFSEEPTWMTPAKINEKRASYAAMINEYPGPMNNEGLKQIAESLRSDPSLVRHLRQVRRTPDGRIELDVSFRKPAAIVRMRNAVTNEPAADGYHVIDDEGYQLFGPVFPHDVYHLGLPRIEYVNSDYRPRDNQGEFAWQGNEVPAGLALLKALRNDPAMDMIETIRVDGRDDLGRIRLMLIVPVRPATHSEPIPCAIIWGLPPGQERSIEPDIDQKLIALHQLLGSGKFRMGHMTEVWINTGQIRYPQAIPAGH